MTGDEHWDLGLAGKVFLVSGGASGIGAAIVEGLAAQGARPVVPDREVAPGENAIRLDRRLTEPLP